MSVQTEINRIKANVTDSFTAVTESGMVTTETQSSDTLASAIRSAFDEVNTLLDSINGTVI